MQVPMDLLVCSLACAILLQNGAVLLGKRAPIALLTRAYGPIVRRVGRERHAGYRRASPTGLAT